MPVQDNCSKWMKQTNKQFDSVSDGSASCFYWMNKTLLSPNQVKCQHLNVKCSIAHLNTNRVSHRVVQTAKAKWGTKANDIYVHRTQT